MACQHQGVPLSVEPKPSAAAIGRAVLLGVVSRAELAGVEVSVGDTSILRGWLGMEEGPPPEPTPDLSA